MLKEQTIVMEKPHQPGHKECPAPAAPPADDRITIVVYLEQYQVEIEIY